MRDVDVNPDEESPYECFECGTIVFAIDDPGSCPDCTGPMRNRRTPIE
jgi:rubrerythrin